MNSVDTIGGRGRLMEVSAVRTQIDEKRADFGPLKGLTWAAKDNYDVSGYISGAGNPEWERTHPPAEQNAWVVDRLLDAGSRLVAKTIMDELAYSLTGENAHYGTPSNSAAPGRIPGGSSSGSAALVSSGDVDFAAGTDTAGSVRVPAAFCGVFGIRYTSGLLSEKGIVPLAQTFDVPGIMSKSPEILQRVSSVLASDKIQPDPNKHDLVILDDAFQLTSSKDRSAFADARKNAIEIFGIQRNVRFETGFWAELPEIFTAIQAFEVWRNHGDWVSRNRPDFGPGVVDRFAMAKEASWAGYIAGIARRNEVIAKADSVLGQSIIIMPTVPCVPPEVGAPAEAMQEFRMLALPLLALASLTGRPQLNIPVTSLGGLPIGISLLGPRGSDLTLCNLALRWNE